MAEQNRKGFNKQPIGFELENISFTQNAPVEVVVDKPITPTMVIGILIKVDAKITGITFALFNLTGISDP